MKLKPKMAEKDLKSTKDQDAYINEVISFFNSGGTLAMLQGIDASLLEQMYTVAYYQYNNGEIEKAEKTFQVLVMLDQYQIRFHLGLGACRQELNKYEPAIEAYSYAAILDLKDPRPPFQAGECYLKLQDLDKATQSLNMAEQLSKSSIKHQELYKKTQEKKQLLEIMQSSKSIIKKEAHHVS